MTDQQFQLLWDAIQRIEEKLSNQTKGIATRSEHSKPSWKCPDCEGPMNEKTAKSGKLWYSCSGYPQCKGVRFADGSVPRDKQSSTKSTAKPSGQIDFKSKLKPSTEQPEESVTQDEVPF